MADQPAPEEEIPAPRTDPDPVADRPLRDRLRHPVHRPHHVRGVLGGEQRNRGGLLRGHHRRDAVHRSQLRPDGTDLPERRIGVHVRASYRRPAGRFLVGWAVLLDYLFLPMVIWLIGRPTSPTSSLRFRRGRSSSVSSCSRPR